MSQYYGTYPRFDDYWNEERVQSITDTRLIRMTRDTEARLSMRQEQSLNSPLLEHKFAILRDEVLRRGFGYSWMS